MKSASKFILAAILLLFASTTLYAQDDGLFYDVDRDGEGLIVLKRDNIVQFSFFSYIERCRHRYFDSEAFIEDKSYNWCRKQQIWYITGQHPIVEGQAQGPLYTANPYDHEDDDLDTLLADVVDVGLFVLTKTPTGYDMIVLQTGNILHPDADIYHRTFKFRQYLFGREPMPKAPE